MEGWTAEEWTALRAVLSAATPGPWHADVLGSEGYAVTAKRPPEEKKRLRALRVARCGFEDWDTDKANAEFIATFDPELVKRLIYWIDVLMLGRSFDMGQENYVGTPAWDVLFRIAELADELRASEIEAAEQEARIDKALSIAKTEWKSQGVKAAVVPLIIKALEGEVDE